MNRKSVATDGANARYGTKYRNGCGSCNQVRLLMQLSGGVPIKLALWCSSKYVKEYRYSNCVLNLLPEMSLFHLYRGEG